MPADCGRFWSPNTLDEFVAIEPESGDYFLGKTLSEATEPLAGPIRIG